jgi:hypothetical protein
MLYSQNHAVVVLSNTTKRVRYINKLCCTVVNYHHLRSVLLSKHMPRKFNEQIIVWITYNVLLVSCDISHAQLMKFSLIHDTTFSTHKTWLQTRNTKHVNDKRTKAVATSAALKTFQRYSTNTCGRVISIVSTSFSASGTKLMATSASNNFNTNYTERTDLGFILFSLCTCMNQNTTDLQNTLVNILESWCKYSNNGHL